MLAKIPSQPRVLLGPQEIAGYYENLERGFLEIGVNARLVTTHPHVFGYGQERENPFFARLASWAVLRHRSAFVGLKFIWATLYLLSSASLAFWAVFRFDIFIFAWGTSFLPFNADLLLYKIFGKRVIVVLGHGSEARPPYMSTPPYDGYPASRAETRALRKQVRAVASTVRRNERFADQVIGMQMTAQFLTREFLDFYRIGLPTPLNSQQHADESKSDEEKFVILHVPSNQAVKGSAHIRKAMETITKKYSDVEYRELSGVSHSTILDAMRSADVVLDWLWSDIPMAVVGTEAAALGKPTVISSYGWEQWDEWQDKHGSEFMPPVIRATPETLVEVLEYVVTNRLQSARVGDRARTFIEEVWTPRNVAMNYLKIIRREYSSEWLMNPESVSYLWGAGVSRRNVLSMVKALMRTYKSDPLRWKSGEHMYKKIIHSEELNSGT